MESLLIEFRLGRPTWFYLSLLLIVAVYFRFGRVWSLRNVDLLLLLSLSPGLLLVENGREAIGFAWLFTAGAATLGRLFFDPVFVRRPRLPQNLNTAGLTFLLAVCAMFHVAAILTTDRLPPSALRTADLADRLVDRQDTPASRARRSAEGESPAGQAATVLTAPAVGLSRAVSRGEAGERHAILTGLPVRIASIFAHAAVVSALVVLGWKTFGDLDLGVAMATLYLLLPCTAYNVAQINHVLPCALILWAVIGYRNPFFAGGLLGLACGTLSFPAFLLPVWMTFYGWKNALRFGAALAAVWVALLGSIAFTSVDAASFFAQAFGQIDWGMLEFSAEVRTTGVWENVPDIYRMPVFALFLVMTGMLCWWPKSRTFESLLARSAALIVGVQFWYPQEGGVYLLWYVPLLLAVVFRPALPQLVPPPVADWPWRRRDTPPAPPPERPAPITVEPVRPLFR